MRSIVLRLAVLVMIGCGAGSGNRDPGIKLAVPPLPPAIAELAPNSVRVNSVPFIMTVNGVNFGTDSIVFWNGVPHTTTVVTSKQLMVALPDTDLNIFGLVPLFVRTAGLNSNTVDFDVTAQ
jgi:IPT/TIG domain